jgi:lysozyme family protein
MGNNEEARMALSFDFLKKAKLPDSVVDQNAEPTTFDQCIDLVIGHEGGYVNDPDDPGGETNWGISKRAYRKVDIKNLTKEDAKAIYKKDYWDNFKVGKLPPNLRYIYFDMCINMGSRNAGKVLQRAANAKNPALAKIKIDGMVGPNTIKAVKRVEKSRLRSERVLYYARIVIKKPVQHKYWYGWFKRSLEV